MQCVTMSMTIIIVYCQSSHYYDLLNDSDLSSPRKARAFHELRYMPLRLNWGPENVHFRKTQFWDPNINVRIFIFFGKFKELPGTTEF